MSYCSRSRRRRFTVLFFKSWAYSRIYGLFQQHLSPISCYSAKFRRFGDVFRWLLHFKFWMSAIFLLPVCLTYWPRKYITRVNSHRPTSIIPTKFEVDMTIHCRVIFFASADTSRDFVTLTFDLLTLNNCCVWRVTCPTLLPSLKTLCLSVLDLWVITFPVGYHWECVRGHCACAESRDPCAGGHKQLHFWNPRTWFAYSLCTFSGSTMNVIKVISENNARPCVKRRMSFCACAKSRDLLKVT